MTPSDDCGDFPARKAGRFAWVGYAGPCPIRAFLWKRAEGQMELAERARLCVVFIGAKDPYSGNFVPLGTGFIALKKTGDIQFQHIVTARHVLDQIAGETVYIRVNVKGGSSEVVYCQKTDWYTYPGTEPYLDVAVCPMMLAQHHFDIVHLDLDFDAYSAAHFTRRLLQVGDEIFVVGLFTSHYGEAHNIPIVRFGHIAAISDEPVLTEYGDMHGLLVEVKSLGGLSGSPVFLRHRDGYIVFIGLMHGHFLVENPEDAISISGKDKPTGQINTGIGLVIHDGLLLNLVNHPDREAERVAAVERIRKRSKVAADAAIGRLQKAALASSPEEADLPSADANPNHREDFNSLVGAAVKKPAQED